MDHKNNKTFIESRVTMPLYWKGRSACHIRGKDSYTAEDAINTEVGVSGVQSIVTGRLTLREKRAIS